MKRRGRRLLILCVFQWAFVTTVQSQGLPALPTTHPKYRVTYKLMTQLAVAFGDRPMPKLTLLAGSGNQQMAQFVPKPEPELLLDEKVYDLSRKFGSDSLAALALVLGHELTHYYYKHADWMGFAQPRKPNELTPLQVRQKMELEAQADKLGAHHAFLAGYDVYKLVAPFYTQLYKAYKRDGVPLVGYANLAERIQLVEKEVTDARRLGMGFEVGLFFLLKGDYATAERCFDFIAKDLDTKELYNNVGLCQLLQATQMMTLSEMPFRYPFEVEIGNRLPEKTHRGTDVDKADLLKKAVVNFQRAIELDETYSKAYINLSTALSLQGWNGTAQENISRLEKILAKTEQPLPVNARLVRAIAFTADGRATEAMAEFERCQDAYELTYNREIQKHYARLSKLPPREAEPQWKAIVAPYAPLPPPKASIMQETSIGLVSLPLASDMDFPDRLAIPQPDLVRIEHKQEPTTAIYRIVRADVVYEMARTLPQSTSQTSRNVNVGDPVQILTTRYGNPERIVPAGGGLSYYCYDSVRFFVAVRDNQVQNWLIYRVR